MLILHFLINSTACHLNTLLFVAAVVKTLVLLHNGLSTFVLIFLYYTSYGIWDFLLCYSLSCLRIIKQRQTLVAN